MVFDLSNLSTNIISDLGPLLALFGEQVAKQFMSESTGFSDNILFAMAPIGIITASVGAIRIGGPNWMKAVIGRARENRAIAEIELMSSTSHEVCELWNGQQIVRIMGAPPIRELVCITREGGTDKLYTLKEATTEGSGAVLRKKRGDKLQRLNGRIGHFISSFMLLLLVGHHEKAAPANLEDGRKPISPPNPRNKRFDEAPNISLNVNAHVSRCELRLFALLATVFQASVLIYAHFAANNQSLRLVFGRLGEYDESSWAVHLIMIGTVGVVMGMLICAFIIEHSTQEEQYHAYRPDDRVHVMWLQKSAAVSDQAFDSYAIFGEESRQVITTSRRNQKFNSPGHDIMFSVLTILGVVAGLLGFLIQMIGYRGMHWTVSIAQLLAIIFTTIIRAWVRRGLSAPTHAVPLPIGYEIDWLATRMAQDLSSLRNRQSWRRHEVEDPEFEGQGCYRWDIITGASSSGYEKLSVPKELRSSTDKTVSHGVDSVDVGALTPSDEIVQSRPTPDKMAPQNRAQMVINSRKDLGRLTRWSGPAADKATSVAKAIEIVLKNTEFITEGVDVGMTGKVLKWRLHALTPKREQIDLGIRHDGKEWKVNVADIEAVLSLWLFAAAEKERGTVAMDDKRDIDAWLRSGEASRGDSIRLLGESNAISRRDMRWWAGSGNNSLIEVSSPSGEKEMIELSSHHVVGYSGYKEDNTTPDVRQERPCKHQYQIHAVSDDNNNMPENESFTRRKISINSMNEAAKRRTGISERTSRPHNSMKSETRPEYLGINQDSTTKSKSDQRSIATMTNVPLEGLFALDIFSAFMWAYAQTPEFKRIAGDTIIQQSDRVISRGGDVSWQSFTLKNSTLSKIAENVSRTGLASVEDVYLTIIPPLSKFRRLPDTGVAIEYASRQAKMYELRAEWDRASQCHLWALSICEPFDRNEEAAIYAIASLTEYLKSLKEVADIMAVYKYSQKDIQWLRKRRESLAKTLRSFSDSYTRQKIHEIYIIQDRIEGNEIWNYQEETEMETNEPSIPLKFNKIHQAVISDPTSSSWADIDKGFRENPEEIRKLVKEKDALGWTPLHYAVMKENYRAITSLLKWGAEWGVLNLAEWSPLHLAAGSKPSRNILKTVRTIKLDVNIQGRGGLTPLNFAVQSNNVSMAEALIDNGANIQAIDNFRRTLLHWAAHYGSIDVAHILLQKGTNIDSADDLGRTALHLAALCGRKEILEALLISGADIEALDRDGKTPVRVTNDTTIRNLLKVKGANMSKNPNEYRSALQEATKDKDIAGVKQLLDAGADPNWKFSSALHTAIKVGESKIIEMFLESKANMDFTNKKGETVTALKVAIDAGNMEAFGLLISKGANKNDSNALRSAAKAGYEDIVKLLIGEGADPNVEDKNGGTTLHAAAEAGQYTIIEFLLSKDIKLAAKNKHGGTALEVAAKLGHSKIIDLLLSQMPGLVNIQNNSGDTALHVGVRGSKEIAVQHLLEKGADVHLQNKHGQTALHLSALLSKEKIVQLLLNHGADPTVKDKNGEIAAQIARKSGTKAIEYILIYHEIDSNQNHEDLHIAARAGNKAVVESLLGKGRPVDSRDTNGGTALQAASSKGHHGVVKQLLNAKANVDLQDYHGRTALHAASEAGHQQVLNLLLEHNVRIDIKDQDGRTALFLAAAAGKDLTVRMLVQNGADIITQDKSERTPLCVAVEQCHEEVLDVLLAREAMGKGGGVDSAVTRYKHPNIKTLLDANGGKLLEKAILNGNEKIVQILLDNYVDTNAPGEKYGSALQAALFSEDVEWLPSLGLLELLLEHGADINAHSDEHCSALQRASAEGYVEAVKLLLDKGADIRIQGGGSPNALMYAISRGNKEVVKLLLESGADVNAQTEKYGTALQAAAATQNLDMAEFLMENGAEVNSPKDNQDNALQMAARDGDSDLVRLLLDHGANVNAQSGEQGSALVQAARYGRSRVVNILLEHGADERDYRSALTQAAGNGSGRVVSLLLEWGADANVGGGCALVQAVKNGFTDVVELLLQNGADAGTALVEAARNGSHIEVILELLKSVTDKSVIGNAYKAADEEGHEDLLALLLEHWKTDEIRM